MGMTMSSHIPSRQVAATLTCARRGARVSPRSTRAVTRHNRQVTVRFQERGTTLAGAPLRVVAVHPCRTPCQPEIVLASGALKTPGDTSPSELVPPKVDVDLPLDGDPRQFPGDVYVLDLFLGLWEDMPGAQGSGPVPLLLTANRRHPNRLCARLPSADTALCSVVAYGLNLWCLRPAKTRKPAPASARAQRLHLRWQRLLKRQPRLPHNGD